MNERSFASSRVFAAAIALFVLLAIGLEALTFVRNIPPASPASAVVFIPAGSTVREISRKLAEENVLASRWKLRFLARITGKEKRLKPGEYRFDLPSPPWTILRLLEEGKVLLHKVTIPEGFTAREIAETVAAAGLADIGDLKTILSRKDLPAHFGLPGESLEGFLFPETYFFARIDDPITMIGAMVARFRRNLSPEDERAAANLGLDLLQWITLASIIEKESSLPEEHAWISSVFHNRLRKRMRLQSDPTVIYGISGFNGNLTRKDLETPTPYNTYTRGGIPPGPIANPGASAIRAAAHPAATDYLYFVADRRGKHVFSRTYEEHRKAVSAFQLGKQP